MSQKCPQNVPKMSQNCCLSVPKLLLKCPKIGLNLSLNSTIIFRPYIQTLNLDLILISYIQTLYLFLIFRPYIKTLFRSKKISSQWCIFCSTVLENCPGSSCLLWNTVHETSFTPPPPTPTKNQELKFFYLFLKQF